MGSCVRSFPVFEVLEMLPYDRMGRDVSTIEVTTPVGILEDLQKYLGDYIYSIRIKSLIHIITTSSAIINGMTQSNSPTWDGSRVP